jgi:PIN domain nuclease of toxin-antitoxin system
MLDPGAPVYIADTHALFWYRTNPAKLSPAADAVFRLADAGGARIVIPAIVVAELFYLTRKTGQGISTADMLADIGASREFVFSELGRAQLEAMEQVEGVFEMHDRLIAAESLLRNAPLITKDEVLRGNSMVEIIW